MPLEHSVVGDTMSNDVDSSDPSKQFSLLHALRAFLEFQGKTQTQGHIKPLHDYGAVG